MDKPTLFKTLFNSIHKYMNLAFYKHLLHFRKINMLLLDICSMDNKLKTDNNFLSKFFSLKMYTYQCLY